MTDKVFKPQSGPQTVFAQCPADIAFFGGAAGSGKSYSLALETTRWTHIEDFGAIVFRLNSNSLSGAGSIWETAQPMYEQLGGHPKMAPLEVRFPSGALVQFSHLQYEKHLQAHQSKQYALIVFDEVTEISEKKFWFLITRNRSTCGVSPYTRATCNPDPDSFVRKLIAWWIGDPDCEKCQDGTCTKVTHGYPNPDRSGKLRWFTRINNKLHWGDTKEEIEQTIRDMGYTPECDALNPEDADATVMSLTFIAAKLEDNKLGDPKYRAKLLAQDEVTRERFLGGNWNIRPAAGKYIKQKYFLERWSGPLPELNIYTASDFAVTEEDEGDDPDFTEHGVFGLDCFDNLLVLDWWSGQTGTEEWIEALLDLWVRWRPLKAFGETGIIRRAVEPALRRRMRERKVYANMLWMSSASGLRSGGKQGYKNPAKRAKAIKGRSFQARASMGKILFPRHAVWADRIIQQVVGFPTVRYDDAFDVLAIMCSGLEVAHSVPERHDSKSPVVDRWAKAFDKSDAMSWKVL